MGEVDSMRRIGDREGEGKGVIYSDGKALRIAPGCLWAAWERRLFGYQNLWPSVPGIY